MQIEKNYKQVIVNLQLRIEKLQKIIFSVRGTHHLSHQKVIFQSPVVKQNTQQTTDLTSTSIKIKQQKPEIYIIEDEQDLDINLLDSNSKIRMKKDRQPKSYCRFQYSQSEDSKEEHNATLQKLKNQNINRKLQNSNNNQEVQQQVSKKFISREQQIIIFKEQNTMPDIEYVQLNSQQQNMLNVSCNNHDRMLKKLNEQINQLRNHMGLPALSVFQGCSSNQEKDQFNQLCKKSGQTSLLKLSVNSQKHLQNQNDKLRQTNKLYLSELQNARKETHYVKNLLKEVLQIHEYLQQ